MNKTTTQPMEFQVQGTAFLPSYDMPQIQWPSKVDWQPQPHRAALLVHDMQDYFLRKYDMTRAPVPSLLQHTARLLDAFRAAGAPVFYTAVQSASNTKPAHDRGLTTDFWGLGLSAPDPAIQAQQGIADAIRPQEGDIVLDKWRYSAFQRTPLAERLRAMGRDQLVVCGVYAHVGCMLTCAEAFMHDVQAFLVADAVADFSREEHEMALQYVATVCGVNVTTQDVLRWMQ